MPDEPDGVGQRERPAAGRLGLAHGRVQGGEQRVLHQHPRAGQHVEQAGLARVGVPGDDHGRHGVAPALPALHLAADLEGADLAAELGDPRPDPAPVGLDLGLTGTAGPDAAAAGHPAARLPGQRLAPAAQPRQHVLQLGQLDLGLALAALGVLGEDVQDQRGAVDHLDLDHALKAAQLARAELAVADHRVRAGRGHDPGQLVRLARAHVGGGVDPAPALDQAVEHHGARGLGEPAELRQGVLRAGQRALGPYADQHDALEAQGTVLDLGDVGELGGEPRHAAQRVPVFQVKFPRRGVHLGPLAVSSCHRPPDSERSLDGVTIARTRHLINNQMSRDVPGAVPATPAGRGRRGRNTPGTERSSGRALAARRAHRGGLGVAHSSGAARGGVWGGKTR